jgi:hypothetical protein
MKAIIFGIVFVIVWIVGAIVVDKINILAPPYAIILVSLEIATIYSIFVDLAHSSVDRY